MTTALKTATQRVEELMEELLQARGRVAQLEALGREAADSDRLRNQLTQVRAGCVGQEVDEIRDLILVI